MATLYLTGHQISYSINFYSFSRLFYQIKSFAQAISIWLNQKQEKQAKFETGTVSNNSAMLKQMAPNYPPFSLTFISTKFAPKAGNFSRTKMYHLSFCWHIWKRRHFNLSNKCPLKNEYNINGFIFYTPLHVVLFSNGGKTFVIFHNTGCRLQPTSYTKREE